MNSTYLSFYLLCFFALSTVVFGQSQSRCDAGPIKFMKTVVPTGTNQTISTVTSTSVHKYFDGTYFVDHIPATSAQYCLGFTFTFAVDTPKQTFFTIKAGNDLLVTSDFKFGDVRTFWITSTVSSIYLSFTAYYEDSLPSIYSNSYTLSTWKNNFFSYYASSSSQFQISFDNIGASYYATLKVANRDYKDFPSYAYWYLNTAMSQVYISSYMTYTHPKDIDMTQYITNICAASTSSSSFSTCAINNLQYIANTVPVESNLYIQLFPGFVLQSLTSNY